MPLYCSEAAYQRAIASVVMMAAEEQAVTPFEARLLDRLDQAVRRGDGRPVPTKRLAVELGGLVPPETVGGAGVGTSTGGAEVGVGGRGLRGVWF